MRDGILIVINNTPTLYPHNKRSIMQRLAIHYSQLGIVTIHPKLVHIS
jgi:hypothetical protein